MSRTKIFNPSSAIRYTDRDFTSIKNSLVQFAKRYYPDTFQDFTAASFGSLVMDMESYIGDILSFYVDYSFNESMLDTAIELNNIIRHGKIFGYKTATGYSSYGTIAMFISVPASTTGLGPDEDYIPKARHGSQFSTPDSRTFILTHDVDFNVGSEVRVGKVDPQTGAPLNYIFKNYGKVVSGTITQESYTVGTYEQFTKIYLEDPNVAEVISVVDSEGNEYYEVGNLSQNTIYAELTNTSSSTPPMLHRC